MRKVLFVAFLVGCASNAPQHFKGPSGNDAYSLKCSGFKRDMQDCYREAAALCPSGYEIINTVERVSGVEGITNTRVHIAVECTSDSESP